jgi:nicotinamide-nucleotide amidase
MHAHLVTVGDELLSGRTVNSNAAFIGAHLAEVGVPVVQSVVVGDDTDEIARAVAAAVTQAQVVVVTGGLGPTHDDVTLEGVARALGVPLARDLSVEAQVVERYRRWGRTLPEGVLRMAMLPEGAEALPNLWGSAPGLHIRRDERHLFVLPGVPSEMRGIMTESILPRLKRLPDRLPVHFRALVTAGVAESRLSDKIKDLIPKAGSAIRLAFLPGYGGVELRLTTQGDESELDRLARSIIERIGAAYVGEATAKDEDLVGVVSTLCKKGGHTLATAESCTGGLLGKLLTDRPGSSEFYSGGVVAYENRIKEKLLGISAKDLTTFGAVSEEVARAMAAGVRERFDATFGLSITGIAGPGGATPDKPVGLIWLGLAHPEGVGSRRLMLAADRDQNRRRAAFAAIDFLRRHLTKSLE